VINLSTSNNPEFDKPRVIFQEKTDVTSHIPKAEILEYSRPQTTSA